MKNARRAAAAAGHKTTQRRRRPPVRRRTALDPTVRVCDLYDLYVFAVSMINCLLFLSLCILVVEFVGVAVYLVQYLHWHMRIY